MKGKSQREVAEELEEGVLWAVGDERLGRRRMSSKKTTTTLQYS